MEPAWSGWEERTSASWPWRRTSGNPRSPSCSRRSFRTATSRWESRNRTWPRPRRDSPWPGMIPVHPFLCRVRLRQGLRSAPQFHLHSEPARPHLRVERRAFRLRRWKDPPGRGGRRAHAGPSEHDRALPRGFHRGREDDGLPAGLAGAGLHPDQPERSPLRVSVRTSRTPSAR